MTIINKITYFIGVLVYLAIIILLISFANDGKWLIWVIVFLSITIIILAYYFIFIHSIKKIEDRHRIATKSILIVFSIIWGIIMLWLIWIGISNYKDYQENIKKDKQIKKDSTINNNLNNIIKDLSFQLFNNKSDLATAKKDINGKEYYLMNYVQDSYEWYWSPDFYVKNWKIARPYIERALDKVKKLINDNYKQIDTDYSIYWDNYTTESRLYWYMRILETTLSLIDNQQYIKDWLDYDKIISTKDIDSPEYKMKKQYGLLNFLVNLEENFKSAEENLWYWYIFNNLPIPNWSGNPDIII